MPFGTLVMSIGWPGSVWSYSSPQPTLQPSGLVGSVQLFCGMKLEFGAFGTPPTKASAVMQ